MTDLNLNQTLSFKEIDQATRELKKANTLQRRNSMLTTLVELMLEQGASEQSIQRALPGLDEFAKCTTRDAPNIPRSPTPESTQPSSTINEEVLGLLLSQIQTQELHWLWQNRIPLGKITILDGDPGMGKSLLAIDIAARVSTGNAMPDSTPGKQGGVILIAPEDGVADTLKPRLEAAAGNPSHILLLNTVTSLDTKNRKVTERPFSLSHNLDILEKAIQRTNAALVIIDPLMAVLGHSTDSSRDQDIRAVFTPLAQLAERTNCAILIIRHLNKSASENALYRGAGSIGIIAAARTGLLAAPHPYHENKRILAITKNNLSQRANNLTYHITANASGIPSIQWLEENTYPLSTLLDNSTNLSILRQQILQALTDATEPLGAQEVTERTGQKYPTVRITLTRMYADREIIRVSRGRYTTIHHPSRLQNRSDTKTTETIVTSETTVTSETIIPNDNTTLTS